MGIEQTDWSRAALAIITGLCITGFGVYAAWHFQADNDIDALNRSIHLLAEEDGTIRASKTAIKNDFRLSEVEKDITRIEYLIRELDTHLKDLERDHIHKK